MPYRKTVSLTSGRREEREKQLNNHRPIESGIELSSIQNSKFLIQNCEQNARLGVVICS